MSTTVNISISIQTTDLIKFYKNAPSWGTESRPFIANNFCNIKAEGAISTGINNVFKLAPATIYAFSLYTTGNDNFNITALKITLSLIKDKEAEPSDWNEIFKFDVPAPTGDWTFDKLGNIFELQTVGTDSFEENYNLQYSIAFQMTNGSDTYYGIIDPLIANTSDEKAPR